MKQLIMIGLNVLFYTLMSFPAWATGILLPGITLSSTRVIYQESAHGHHSATLTITNTSPGSYLIQSQVVMPDEKSWHVSQRRAPFIVVPPLFRLNPGDSHVLKIIRTGGTLPSDKESLFYLTTRFIPQAQKPRQDGGPTLSVGYQWNMKLLYRPSAITDEGIAWAASQLKANQHNGNITLLNPTPYWMTLTNIRFRAREAGLQSLMTIPPNDAVHFSCPEIADNTLDFHVIDERGNALPVFLHL